MQKAGAAVALSSVSQQPIFDPNNDDNLDIDPAEVKKIQQMNIAIKIVNTATSGLMAAAAVLTLFINTTSDVGTGFMAAYVLFFSVLFFCFECAFPGCSTIVAQNFGFMYALSGRTIFLMFCAGMCARLGTIGYAAIALIGFSWLFYMVVVCKHPQYEQYYRRKHYRETRNAIKKQQVTQPKKKMFGIV